MLTMYPQNCVQPGYEGVKSQLCLYYTGTAQADPAPMALLERQETAVYTLGETAASCDALELDSLLLLAAEAATDLRMLPLVMATFDWVAASMGYADRHAYFAWHQLPLLHAWCVEGMKLRDLHKVHLLIAPSPQAAVDPMAFWHAAAPALTAAMLFVQDVDGLSYLYAMLGIQVSRAVTARGQPNLNMWPKVYRRSCIKTRLCVRAICSQMAC
jgi:hypothetical protein